MGPRAGADNLVRTVIRSPVLLARSQSLYRLRYPGPHTDTILIKPSDYFTYRQVYHSKTLEVAHIAFMCFVRSHNKQRILPYTTLAD